MKLNWNGTFLTRILGGVALIAILGFALAACQSDGESPAADPFAPGEDEALSSDGGPLGDAEAQAREGASASSGAPGGEAPAADPKLQVVSRKIIQSTSIDVGVEDVARNFQEILRIAETEGGHIVSSSLTNVDDEQAGDVTIRVPHDRYQDVLGRIRLMGDVTLENSEGNDVTEEYTDLQARLRTLEATEQRYLDLLGQAKDINEILTVQDRLDGVRGQIEQVVGRINLLDGLTEMSTITVHLRLSAAAADTAPNGGPHPLRAAEQAWDASLNALRGMATAVVVVGVFFWWLLPPLAGLALFSRWWRTSRRQPPAAPVT